LKKDKTKYNFQQKMLDTIDRLFFVNTKKKTLLLNNPASINKEDIIDLDIQITELIKKRARLTKGGYKYIIESMWEWAPFSPIDKSLMPKTV
tara:strand:- start:305 stop:580 length:276 start_codon:yes stop_codon:yes gene_type:complete